MPGCEPWDVVRVPFPYTNRPVQQRRPALVVALHAGEGMPDLLWVLMITSAAHRRWPDDVEVSDPDIAGLPVPSVVRPVKIATGPDPGNWSGLDETFSGTVNPEEGVRCHEAEAVFG